MPCITMKCQQILTKKTTHLLKFRLNLGTGIVAVVVIACLIIPIVWFLFNIETNLLLYSTTFLSFRLKTTYAAH